MTRSLPGDLRAFRPMAVKIISVHFAEFRGGAQSLTQRMAAPCGSEGGKLSAQLQNLAHF